MAIKEGTEVLKLGLDPQSQVARTIIDTGFLKAVFTLILPNPRAAFELGYLRPLCFLGKKKSVGARRGGDHIFPEFPTVCDGCLLEIEGGGRGGRRTKVQKDVTREASESTQ